MRLVLWVYHQTNDVVYASRDWERRHWKNKCTFHRFIARERPPLLKSTPITILSTTQCCYIRKSVNYFQARVRLPELWNKMYVWPNLLFLLAAIHVTSGTWVKGTGTVTRLFHHPIIKAINTSLARFLFLVMAIWPNFYFTLALSFLC